MADLASILASPRELCKAHRGSRRQLASTAQTRAGILPEEDASMFLGEG